MFGTWIVVHTGSFMKFVALCLLVVGIAGCKTNNRHGEASRAKMYDGMPADGANAADANKKGVCLSYSTTSRQEPECKDSTMGQCKEQKGSRIKLTFVSSANCKCYKMEGDYLAKNPPADEPYEGDINADSQDSGPQWALTNSSRSRSVRGTADGASPAPGPDDAVIDINGGLEDFYKEHPECVVAKEDTLMP
ncbi:MAG: hypothetical protein WCO71_01450 [Pseudomonadota bacterium]